MYIQLWLSFFLCVGFGVSAAMAFVLDKEPQGSSLLCSIVVFAVLQLAGTFRKAFHKAEGTEALQGAIQWLLTQGQPEFKDVIVPAGKGKIEKARMAQIEYLDRGVRWIVFLSPDGKDIRVVKKNTFTKAEGSVN